jgi:hypothetical protein
MPTLTAVAELNALLAQHRKISVREAAELNNISEDTFRRRHGALIKQISPRRQAVDLSDALAIGNPSAA